MERQLIPTDRLLSAWIVVYAYLYIFGVTPYNPILLLYIAYSFVILSSIVIVQEGKNMNRYIMFLMLNSFFKLIPIILVWNHKITVYDIVFTCVFVLVYIIYMYLMRDDIICLYKDLVYYIIDQDKGRETYISHSLLSI